MRKEFLRLQNRLKGLPAEAAWRLGLRNSVSAKNGEARMLVYHGICEEDHLRYNTLFLTQKLFEKQLQLFSEYMNVVSLDEFFMQQFPPDKFSVALSFDDGLANNYKYVLPLLEKYRIPAVFFLTAARSKGYDILWNDVLAMAGVHGPVNITIHHTVYRKDIHGRYRSVKDGSSLQELLRKNKWEWKEELFGQLGEVAKKANEIYWRQLSEEEIRAMAKNPWVTIGAHGLLHQDLVSLSRDELKEDLTASKKYLEEISGKKIRALAFPYGSYNEEVIGVALECGYTQLLTTGKVVHSDYENKNLLHRLTINPFISPLQQLHATINGKY